MERGKPGSAGGRKTAETHGSEHMQAIGQRGFQATVNRDFGGDKASYLRFPHGRATEKGVGGFVARLLKERLDNGEKVASVEIPILADAEDAPWF